jgi:V8-like Glu-specific endopeptidase
LIGTGWLVSPYVVVTAGHCVFLKRFQSWAQRVNVFPARDGGSRPSAHSSGDLHSVSGWTERGTDEYDYGAIILSEPARVHGQFGCRAAGDGELTSLRAAHVAGYPIDKPPGTLWVSARALRKVNRRTLTYDLSTAGGQSGAPVFYKRGDERGVVAIHAYGSNTENQATRVTGEVLRNVEEWVKLGRANDTRRGAAPVG